jgi:hypothetical protein
MALRDQLNVSIRSELYNYVMQSDQILTALGVASAGDVPAELWYFAAASMAVDDGVTVIRPTSITASNPGRYLRTMQETDWSAINNRPTFATVATSGNYSDLSGTPNLSNYYSVSNPSGYISGISSGMIAAALGYTPANTSTSITINGITQDLSTNRSWTVGDIQSSGSYSNPSWITSLAQSKVTYTGTTSQYVRGDGSLATFPSIPASQVNSDWNAVSGVAQILNKPSLATVATTGAYTDLTGKPTIYSFTGLSTQYTKGDGTYATFPTNISSFTNDIGYLTSITSSQVVTALGFTPLTNSRTISINGNIQDLTANRTWTLTSDNITEGTTNLYFTNSRARAAISLNTTGTSGAATYNSTTGVLNIPQYEVVSYRNNATIASNPIVETFNGVVAGGAGNVVFYLTTDGTSTGTALYTNVNYVLPVVNDSTTNYTYGWTISTDKKTLTINVKATPALAISLLGLTLLGVPANASNGTSVNCLVVGN